MVRSVRRSPHQVSLLRRRELVWVGERLQREAVRKIGATHVWLDGVNGGHDLGRRPLRVRGCASRSTGMVGVNVMVRGDARESRLRMRVVMGSSVAGHVLSLIGIVCREFRNSRELGIIRMHRVSLGRSRDGRDAGVRSQYGVRAPEARRERTQDGDYQKQSREGWRWGR